MASPSATPAAPAPAHLYFGRTAHQRLQPFGHRFSYRIASLLLDIDRLDEADAMARFFSVDRFNLLSFRRRDHGARIDAPLRPWAEDAFARAGVSLDGGRVLLMCLPRMLGYVFNPLSLWFGYGPDQALRGVVYEVHNTFGDAHAYAASAPSAQGGAIPRPLRQEAAKIFHVSPFFPAQGRYAFSLRAPSVQPEAHDDPIALTIRYLIDDTPTFAASQTSARRPLTDAHLARVFFGMPLFSLKVIAAIHWEALRLVLKGARYHRRPHPPAPVSVATAVEALRVDTGPAAGMG